MTQCYNDGVVDIYSVTDVADSGYLPKPQTSLKAHLCYQERRLSYKRYYDAKQNQIRIEKVIRVPNPGPSVQITSQDIAAIEGCPTFRVDLVQIVPDVCPPSLDITLVQNDQGVISFIPVQTDPSEQEPAPDPGAEQEVV